MADWTQIDDDKYLDEATAVSRLLAMAPLNAIEASEVVAEACRLVRATRAASRTRIGVETLLQQFSLDTQEGLALMCLAEALLRTPDVETRDRLIAERIGEGDWARHLWQSDSFFVNASTWGLMLTGRLVTADEDAQADFGGWLKRLVARVGEPVIREAVAAAVRLMGEQFILGTTIGAALERARKEKLLCSFDMLGEGARTIADADHYEALYAAAITAVGRDRITALGPEQGHGVSVKLSALSPRYEAVQAAKVWDDLYPRLKRLAVLASTFDMNLAVDAEEADRLVISLQIVDRLAREPDLGNWTGLGVVVQAYQKRGLDVIKGLEALSIETGRRIMVRLVKGAYWDSEVKRAQIAGRPDYPVFTTKAATDLSYLVCANALIAASPNLFPQFATHNAHTLAAVQAMARRAGVAIEHQRLHGMGEALYRSVSLNAPLRVYAPVGGQEQLLPYLVRRLLENGANTSFVRALVDDDVPPEQIVDDPIAVVRAHPDRHPRLAPPPLMFGVERTNSLGRDYSIEAERSEARRVHDRALTEVLTSGPIIGGIMGEGVSKPLLSPVDRTIRVGIVAEASAADIDEAARRAKAAQPAWNALGGPARAVVLRAMAAALDGHMNDLIALMSREAGKTLVDGVSEVREAIDFCRYYANLAERQMAGPVVLKGPAGETNQLELHGRGVFVCISPWNFPLAIFTGQIAAALAAGNAVLAKPAEQTPLIAAWAVSLFHAAGLNPDLLALLPGDGAKVGAKLVSHQGIDGVLFTGGTDTGWAINRQLAAREGPMLPLVAETGGLNAMFVDTTALKEQVVDDVIASAFGSAGQRCSALRLLYVPNESADELIETLSGALACMTLGDPSDPATDIGPVIDDDARAMLERHVQRLEQEARIIARLDPGPLSERGSYFGPVIAEIPRSDFLDREVFGPILHIYRYGSGELDAIAKGLAGRGYGLTLGIHSRLKGFAEQVRERVPAGNVYINRSIIGAVVGVQPFGGLGLSGTGPKAGGPHALDRLVTERAVSVNIMAQGGDPSLLNL